MGLYLYIAQVDVEGSSMRLFLCGNVMNEMHMLTLHDANLIYVMLTQLDKHDIGLSLYI